MSKPEGLAGPHALAIVPAPDASQLFTPRLAAPKCWKYWKDNGVFQSSHQTVSLIVTAHRPPDKPTDRPPVTVSNLVSVGLVRLTICGS